MSTYFSLLSFSFVTLLCFASDANSLVDYSDPDETGSDNPSTSLMSRSATEVPSSSITEGGSSWKKQNFIDFSSTYTLLNVKTSKEGQVGLININTHFDTGRDIFLDLGLWGAQTKSDSLARNSGFQRGNLEVLLGLNWLSLGNSFNNKEGETHIDLFGGFSWGEGKSDLATSRNDKIVGVQSRKRWSRINLNFGGEYRFVSKPKRFDEMVIGNIGQVGGEIGVLVAQGLMFSLAGSYYTISRPSFNSDENSGDDFNGRSQKQSVHFSGISPRINLMISSYADFMIGSHFALNRPSKDFDLVAARLYSLPYLYGDSVFVGLNLYL